MPDQQVPFTARQRVIRVFISSTFRDMHAERDELVKRTFPQLRKMCEQRGVTWGDVDLRWGIPDERKAEVLPICLAEIHRCRPYFIGLLGERYGWVPDEIPQELIEEHRWLKEHLEHSVTELEILHGVLRNPDMTSHAFFYFRHPAYIDTLPAEQQPEFREGPTEEEIERYGREAAERRADERRRKLAALKERIRAGKFTVRENYRNPQELGQLVLDDLTRVINTLFPEEQKLDPLDREAAAHEAFAASRAGVYIGRQEYFDRLDAHAAGDDPPLVVLGESGGGKSALLANWALKHRQEHPDSLLIQHFIGASPYSADWAAMLRRIMGEFQRRFGIKLEIPDKPDALRLGFANSLHMAAAQGRVVLILDALNQLEDRDGAPDLVWLPPEIPANVRLILSTLPGRPLDDLKKRGWPTLIVEPLTLNERKELIPKYLAHYTKELSSSRVERVAAAEQSANPLYLRALLEELRVFGAHERLDERITHYLSALTIPELYEKILQRWEEDYERDRPGLVRDAMTLLWAARRGLSEAELLELLGSDGQPLPRAHWSPLSLAADQALVSRSGLIGFSHDYVRQAAHRRFLWPARHLAGALWRAMGRMLFGRGWPCRRAEQAAHLRLADYFAAPDLNPRQVDELPWQLQEAGAWPRLAILLAGAGFFGAAWQKDQFEVKAYWTRIELNSPLRLVETYRAVIDDPGTDLGNAWIVGMLLADTGHPGEALRVRALLVDHYRQTGDQANLAMALGGQALILQDGGDLDGAIALHKEQERICRGLGNKDGLPISLSNQALILYARGDLDGAMALHKEAERICRELGNKHGLSISLGNQAAILHARGDLDGAMALWRKQERICRELGNKDGLQGSLGNQAAILHARGDLDGAMALHKEKERICRELGNKDGLQRALGNQGLILYARGDLDAAMALHKEKERICRELGNKDGLHTSLGNQAAILYARGDLDGAMRLHKQEERICRELGSKDGLRRTLGNQALILQDRGDLDGAMVLHKQEERICRELGNLEGLAHSLVNQAIVLHRMPGRSREARPLAEEALELASRHGFVTLAKQIQGIRDSLPP
jgi:tetratricopeptide (TPR) repeat protein